MSRLSPQLSDWLIVYHQKMEALLAGGFVPTPENARRGLADLTGSLVPEGPQVARVQDEDLRVAHGRLPVRIYHPLPEAALPVLVYYHGGGHMAGSVKVYDPICRRMALATRHIVVSVDYRLAPEHPYPAGVKDAFVAVEKVWTTLDRTALAYEKRLSIGGDSGGGALCATVAHMAQKHPEIEIRRQVLIYPSLDYTMSHPSVEINGSGYLLEKEKMQWYFDHYFQNDEDRRKASPLYMEIGPRMTRTLVITAEFCPLRDEGAAYVRRLARHGIRAERLHFDDMIHAFLNMERVAPETCRRTYDAIARFLAKD